MEIRLLRVITAVRNLENVHGESADGFQFVCGKSRKESGGAACFFSNSRLSGMWHHSGLSYMTPVEGGGGGGKLLHPDV